MANKLKQVRINRDNAVDRINEFYNFSLEAITDESLHTEFKVRYKALDRLFNDYNELHSSLLTILANQENPDIAPENEVRSITDRRYYAIQTNYSNLFDTQTLAPQPSTQSHIKLPKLNVPVFDGSFKMWPTFIDLFNALIHNNESLTNIEKFQYLLSLLDKEPFTLVKNLPLCEDNYIIAYDNLYKRYQNTRMLATYYFDEIFNAQKINSEFKIRNLIDLFNDNLNALRNLHFPVEHWDFILFYLLSKKVDSESLKRFELQHTSTAIPTFKELESFLLTQCNAFDSLNQINSNIIKQTKPSYSNYKNMSKISLLSNSSKQYENNSKKSLCPYCNSNHIIYKCDQFIKNSPLKRFEIVKQKGWCTNCLGTSHTFNQCNSTTLCKFCNRKHHSLLHFSQSKAPPEDPVDNRFPPDSNQFSNQPGPSVNTLSNSVQPYQTVLLSTAEILLLDSHGHFQKVRALLDTGSQTSLITEKCARKLGLKVNKLSFTLNGFGQTSAPIAGRTNTTLRSCLTQQSLDIDFLVLPKICADMPVSNFSTKSLSYISSLKLADPQFNTRGAIDVLLGAEMFPLILSNGRIIGENNNPSALNTIFGWIIMGKLENNCTLSPQINSLFINMDYNLDALIKRFWEIEEVPNVTSEAPDDIQCEKIFQETYSRTISGRYSVSLPFRSDSPIFSNTRDCAVRRFLSLERKLIKNPSLYKQYSEFIQDYIDCGHMELCNPNISSIHTYYIPHHSVLKPDSTTTKLRVVFDASAKAPPDNLSLNDTLLTGTKLQTDIVSVLLNFRLHKIVLLADIKQMYRQILINDCHKDFQRIVWRFTPEEPLQDYRLNTVTYGVSSAPFLAIRTLHQLARDELNNFPLASHVVKNDIYIDDIVTGCNTLNEAIDLKAQLIALLSKGQFELRKWASNDPEILRDIPQQDLQLYSHDFDSGDSVIKVLGLQWDNTYDFFCYTISPIDRPCTKRSVLSELARIFDPLGFLSPLSFYAKHLIQHLWGLGLEWDEAPPPDVMMSWLLYKKELSLLSSLKIPRHLLSDNFISCDIQGFADSSEKGYAAVVYLRLTLPGDKFKVHFVCAKSKVAPLKRLSLPRLELCAAVLLAKLIKFILNTYSGKIHINRVFAWSDSSITLSWIKSSPHRWKTFVSNRVSYIQEHVPSDAWHHVKSESNPADCASRGLSPSQLLNHELWWTGPSWLKTNMESWPMSTFSTAENTGEERRIVLSSFLSLDTLDKLLEKFSSISKLKRIVAYCFRFLNNLKYPLAKAVTPFTEVELQKALLALVKRTQFLHFESIIDSIVHKSPLSKTFRKLNLFITADGILRVGGRLRYSSLSYDQKYPILLPRDSRLTELIIEDMHCRHLHPGLQTLQFLLAQQFWILSPRRAIRHILSKCYKCFRLKPTPLEPFMGNLPPSRVSQIKPFQCVGVDFAGPFFVTPYKGRGVKSHKAYICLFVCFATKAVHLELVSDLSSDAFIAALRRFVGRRGRCIRLFSDNGTNFVGAFRQLSDFMKSAAETERIEWSFNPPSAPHFGGLWESNIKSVKTHFLRVIGEQVLTFEEFYTVLVQIEALLNSRPLCPLSSDPQDLSVLTPGHFLTLEPLSAVPDSDLSHLAQNRLNRWQLLQRLQQDFWKRWHTEYLHTLQQRQKWTRDAVSISPGSIVLIKNELTPPLRWSLGRIIELHKGRDGIPRVATLKTSQGFLKRPLVKLCPLPSQ